MKKIGWVILAILLIAVLACAPKGNLIPPPFPPASMPAPVSTLQLAPTLNPQDAAWAKVVTEAKKEGKVTMYSFGFTGDWGKEVIKGFENAYGIKIEIVGGVGAVLLERIKSEKAAGKQIADTYDSAPSFLLSAKAAGLLVPVDFLPELAKEVKWRLKPLEPDKIMYPYYLSVGAPYVNTTVVKAGMEPKSYKELLQPQWKGKIALAPPVADPTGIYAYVAWKRYGTMDADGYYRQLGKQDLKVVATVRDVSASVTRGEVAISYQSTGGIMNSLIAQGAPVKPLALEEGQVITWGATIAATKDGPHPNATKVLINWLLTAEGQIATNKARGAVPIREDVSDFAPEAARLEVTKPLLLEIPDLMEMSRLQREMVVDKIMGLEGK